MATMNRDDIRVMETEVEAALVVMMQEGRCDKKHKEQMRVVLRKRYVQSHREGANATK